MKKLEDIPKKQVFNVPEDYFTKLPQAIQARVAVHKKSPVSQSMFIGVLRYAIPMLLLLGGITTWFINSPSTFSEHETILATVQTEDLITYLNESDLTTDELLETVDFNTGDLDEIEEAVYHLNIPDKDFEDVLNDVELNNL